MPWPRSAHPTSATRRSHDMAGAFLASAVEMVEALTIVLGVGVVRGWRSTLIGVGAAPVVLGALVVALGPALELDPDHTLRLVVGVLLLAFGCSGCARRSCARAATRPARRGRGLPRGAGAGRGGGREERGRTGLVRVHGRVQGRPARGARGRLHRDRLRKRAGAPRPAPRRRGGRTRASWSSPGCSRRARWRACPRTRSSSPSGSCSPASACFWGAEGAGVDWPGDELALLGVIAFFGAAFVRSSCARCAA